ncbi:hypothetical protein COJ90_21095 [Priestia megaterium]|uniref:hypothetical protein n=1 Tax=Priestia megaterium TaxID=1404 RepID=UPI000BF3CC71|nr:hypothetical protein [Priestia megaterium]PFP09212.1 hypothetical protein COJ90_21095 [Priestia megaterium]
MKQVSFSLFTGQELKYKSLVPTSLQSKMLRNYILNEYKLPDDLTVYDKANKQVEKPTKFHFDETTNTKLNDLVQEVKAKGYAANRSSIVRHIIDELINKLLTEGPVEIEEDDSSTELNSVTGRKPIRLNFYFQRGTKDLLDKFIPFRDRNATIENFIINDYKVGEMSVIKDAPTDREQICIRADEKVFNELDVLVNKINDPEVTRTALMRDVVHQLISKLANSDSRLLLSEKKLDESVSEIVNVSGAKEAVEILESYIKKYKE